MTARVEAVRSWYRDQSTISLAAGAAGALAVATVVVGGPLLFVVNGLVPHERLLDTARGRAMTTLLGPGIDVAAAAIAVGFGTYKRMVTKAARETAISGGALGIQAVLLAALFLFFRAGEKFPLLVRQNFSFDVLGEFGREFVTGARNTVILAGGGEFFGIVLGLFLAMLILSSRAVVRAPARTYINFFRGTPLIWQLSFIFAAVVLTARLPVSVFQVGILVLGLNAGAYSAEIFRAGIQSIERGQIEAARSLGMSYLKAMRYVILPQAFRRVIPPLTNEFIILIKDTSLIFVLGLTESQRELFGIGRDAYSETFNATPYLGSVLGYLAITLPMIWVVTRLERRLQSGLTGVIGR